MTLRHLKIFVTVAECGKMGKAAELLFVSQPSISQAVRELEDYYEVKLFDRLSKRIYLTESGKQLYTYAKHILTSFEDAREAMKERKDHPILRIGCSVSVGTVMLEGVIDEFERQMPQTDLRVTINNTSTIEGMLLSSELDLAMIEGKLNEKDMEITTIGKDELVMVVGRSHPLYGGGELTLESLAGQTLISREDGSTDRNQFELLLAQQNIQMIRKWNCTNTEAIKNAVIAGRGIAIMSTLLIQKELKEQTMQLLHLKGVEVKRSIRLVHHKNKFITEPMKCFMDTCNQIKVL